MHNGGLMQAVQADPEDDAPRLVYADWLEEQGDAESLDRAELIRVQCRLPGMAPDEPGWLDLHFRERELLAEYDTDWERELPEVARCGIHFRRGFIAEAALLGRKLLECGEELFRLS